MTNVKPIPFKPQMVRSIHKGDKTQTRRDLTIRGHKKFTEFGPSTTPGYDWCFGDADMRWHDLRHDELLKLLKYQVGDLLWVKETWGYWPLQGEHEFIEGCTYKATDEDEWECRMFEWSSPIFMPRKASRTTLEVTEVRVQRLQDISEDDAIAEGLVSISKDGKLFKWGIPDKDGDPGNDDDGWHWRDWQTNPRNAYAHLWNTIHGLGAWEANPWVAAYSFKVYYQNVDALLRERAAA